MALVPSENARRVLEARYLRRGARGEIVETPDELFVRVARAVARAETEHGSRGDEERFREAFLEAMLALDFLPNSPTLMNAGTALGQLSACFVLPVGDSLRSIFDALKTMALVQQSGGGTGFSFSRVRPRGDIVASTGGLASGPVSFMRIFDCATENVRQGGRRRGANMGVLAVDHPDVLEFIDAKLDGTSFSNFNLSIAATDTFMRAVQADGSFELRHPRTRASVGRLPARQLFERIGEAAWRTGDPGLFFIDAANRANPTPDAGPFEATNPCGEVPLLANEACNLGSINLSHMIRGGSERASIDWEKLARTVRLGVRFLDDVISIGRWPTPEIEAAVKQNRKIGLGVMGFAELLIELEIPYASERAVNLADELMAFVADHATSASEELGRARGPFPGWARSIFAEQGRRVRNATRTSIAPTGTISLLAGTSASIEPLFALAFRHTHVLEGQSLVELSPLFRRARELVPEWDRVVAELADKGSLAAITKVPDSVRNVFRTALEIPAEDHLRIQAAFQSHVDNAVSKTVNLPESASPADVLSVYRRAWELGLKGVTVYRYGSKGQQVLELGVGQTAEERERFVRCDPEACKL